MSKTMPKNYPCFASYHLSLAGLQNSGLTLACPRLPSCSQADTRQHSAQLLFVRAGLWVQRLDTPTGP